jgi:glutaminyl-peptide cyclotransferase
MKLVVVTGCVLLGTLTIACKPENEPPKPKSEIAAEAVATPALPVVSVSAPSASPVKIEAMLYLREIVAIGRRAVNSPGHAKMHAYLRRKLQKDTLEEDPFTAQTPIGPVNMINFIAKYPGTTSEIIVIASHYDTNYPLKNFVGANDGGSSSALLLALADIYRGMPRSGPAIWLVWLDGEEAIHEWSATDGLYGSRHLAQRWHQDGTAKRIKAFLLTDMIGDRDLSIDKEANSTPWLSDLIYRAATNLGTQSYFYRRETLIEDDHIPFARIGVPVVDIIDLDYGYNNVFHHSPEDTIDKISPKSIQIVGSVVVEAVRLLSQ